jgi:hypothetical protein
MVFMKRGFVEIDMPIFQDIFLNEDEVSRRVRTIFFGQVHPFDIQTDWNRDVVTYGGVSEQFDEISEGTEMPTYHLHVNYDEEGNFEGIDFERKNES